MSGFDAVLEYWLEPEPTTQAAVDERRRFWFNGGAAVDREIGERFGALVQRGCRGELDAWSESPRGALALIIILDQFPRNLFRGTAAAFASDARALALAGAGFDAGWFSAFGTAERTFATLPFHHSENVEDQKRGVTLSVQTALRAPPHYLSFAISSVDAARKHLDTVVRFGRFPHRNAALGLASTPAELEYLEYLELAHQWL